MTRFIFLLCILLPFMDNVFGDIPSSELSALEDLYNSTNGQDWYWLPEEFGPRWFNGSADPCNPEWQGIYCLCTPDESCIVNEIFLPNYNLEGTIPYSIGNFSDLANLDFANNSLYSSIPPTIGKLTKLNSIYLNSNNLTGPIPDEFYEATNLNVIMVFENKLTGTISPSLGYLTEVNTLYYYNNNFTGSIPGTLNNLNHLRRLEFDSNRLNGSIPSNLFDANKALTYIELNNNQLTGSIPNTICSVSSLLTIQFYVNNLTGTVPECIGELTSLQGLYLFANHLNGSIPESLYNITSLAYLWVNTNNITGTISNNIGQLTSMVHLGLYETNLTGSFPNTLGGMQALEWFYVYSTHMHGTIPDSLYDCQYLSRIIISSNHLTGSISNRIGQVNLTYFVASYNEMTGTIPSGICNPYLYSLMGYRNHFNGTIPECLFHIETLENLGLAENNLTSSIPSNIGKLDQMLYLSLYSNQLTGTIPESLAQMTALEILFLSENNFNGSIPEALFHFESMYYMEFYHNELTGTIPNSIGNMTMLMYFYGYNNYFVGTLPDAICRAPYLTAIGMNGNHFSGRFPDCIWGLSSLSIVSIGDNDFSGTLPNDVSALPLSELLMFQNSISGSLPTYGPVSLVYISLEDNQMTGSLADSLFLGAPYTNLLTLDGNYFTGIIPPSVGQLTYLASLSLEQNILSGTLPDLTYLYWMTYFSVNNNMLTGSVSDVFNCSVVSQITNIDLSSNQFTGTIPTRVFTIPTLLTFAAVSNCFTGTLSEDLCKATQLTALALDGLHTASSCRDTILPRISDSYDLNYYWSGGIPECLFNLSYINTLHVSGNGIGGTLPSNLTLGPYLVDLALSYNQFTGHIPESIGQRVFQNVDLSFNRFGGIMSASPYQSEESTVYYQVNRLSGNIPSVLRDVETISVLNGNHFLCRLDREQLPKHDKQYSYYECGTSSLERSIYVWIGMFAVAVVGLVVMWGTLHWKTSLIYVKESAQTLLDNVNNWMNIFRDHESNPLNVQLLGTFMRDLRRSTAYITLYVVLILIPVNVVLSQYYDTYQYGYAWSVGSVYLTGFTAAVVLCALFALLLLWMMVVFAVCLPASQAPAAGTDRLSIGKIQNSEFGTRIVLSLAMIAIFNFAVVLSVNIGYVLVATRYNPTIVAVTQIVVSIYKLVWNDLIIRNLVGWAHRYWSSVCSLSAAEESEWSGSYMTFNTFTMIFNVIVIPCMATAAVSSDCFYDVLVPPSKVKSYYTYTTCGLIIDSVCASAFGAEASTSYLPPYIYRYQCSSTLVATYAILYVYNFIILSFFQPLLVIILQWQRRNLSDSSFLYMALVGVGVIVTDASRLFDKDRFNLRMIMYLSIFVTFGVIFPPLAVMILVTVVVQTYFTQLHLGHFIAGAGVESESNRWIALQVLDESCKRVSVLFKQTVYVVCPCAAFFYAYTVYDTYADAGGGNAAVWMSCSLFVAGCVVTAMYKVVVHKWTNSEEMSGNGRSSVIEIGGFKSENPIHSL